MDRLCIAVNDNDGLSFDIVVTLMGAWHRRTPLWKALG